MVMIKKPNNSYRMCINLKAVNAMSEKDAYLTPYMDVILNKLKRAKLSSNKFKIRIASNNRIYNTGQRSLAIPATTDGFKRGKRVISETIRRNNRRPRTLRIQLLGQYRFSN